MPRLRIVMQKHSTHKNATGFTLIELLIVIAIIGILAVVAIPQFNQYKIRGYDAHSKQALRDMNVTCKIYWTETSSSDECDLAKTKEHGFVQNPEVVANVVSTLPENFCASAKHNSSPNTYSIDSAALISEGGDCGGAGGSVQSACFLENTFEGYKPPEEIECTGRDSPFANGLGMWAAVAPDGQFYDWGSGGRSPWILCNCAVCGPGGRIEGPTLHPGGTGPGGLSIEKQGVEYQWVFGTADRHSIVPPLGNRHPQAEHVPGAVGRHRVWDQKEVMDRVCGGEYCRCNAATGIWTSVPGEYVYRDGRRVDCNHNQHLKECR